MATDVEQQERALEPEETQPVASPVAEPVKRKDFDKPISMTPSQANRSAPLVSSQPSSLSDSYAESLSSSVGRKRSTPRRRDKRTGEAMNRRLGSGSSLISFEAKYPPLEFIESLATPPDYVFKVLVVGNSYVGKSSFLMRLCTNAFTSRYSSTIGVDFYSKALQVDDLIVSLQLWDTAGQERFQSVTKAYYRGAQGVILMYDISQEESFIAVKSWINSIQENVEQMPPGMLLVGNKQDLDEQNEREVSTETGETFAKIYGADFMETSAKTGYNVGNALLTLVRSIKQHYDESVGQRKSSGVTLSKQQTGSRCCGR